MLFHYSDFPRFWSKVGIGAPDECWPWLGGLNGKGYGILNAPRVKGQKRQSPKRVHRLSYELLIGPIPNGLTLAIYVE